MAEIVRVGQSVIIFWLAEGTHALDYFFGRLVGTEAPSAQHDQRATSQQQEAPGSELGSPGGNRISHRTNRRFSGQIAETDGSSRSSFLIIRFVHLHSSFHGAAFFSLE